MDGPVQVKIPEGTQSGRELRVKGRGVPLLNGKGQGDLVVRLVVQTPRKLTKAQRDLMAKLGESMSVDNRPSAPGLLDRVKDLFS
jgi:molecular chaperone DnaJ